MAKPYIHSMSSVAKFKGKSGDYDEIHNMLDSSKSFFPDNRHRAIFHHSGGVFYMEKIFGIYFEGIIKLKEKYNLPDTFEADILQFLKDNRNFGTCIKNSDGKKVSVRDIAEQHILEDYKFKFIPTVQDFLQEMDFLPWMQNAMGKAPSSHKKIDGVRTLTDKPLETENPCLEIVLPEAIVIPEDEIQNQIKETLERLSKEGKKRKPMVFDGRIRRGGLDDNSSRVLD